MDKETLAALIDAYADAKATKNKILIKSMIENLERALNIMFPESAGEGEGDPEATGGLDITEY
tara:strand:+ start:5509 stop:5697 length:189 start_codon:yes stop_codon:yes gene_type:complete